MPRRDTSLVHNLPKTHPSADALDVYFWTDTMGLSDEAHYIEFAYEEWLESDRSTPPPNLVDWVAYYGLARYRLQEWKLPVDLSPSEMTTWRKAGYYVELIDFQESLGEVAAGFMVFAGYDPQLTVDIIKKQLAEKQAELDRLASLPLSAYTPHNMEWQVRKSWEGTPGLHGQALEAQIKEDMFEAEDDHDKEVQRFDEPFNLRQQLQSFEWGLENYRMIAFEHNPDLGLPNLELFEATMQIDANNLLHQLGQIDKKLRIIWQHLAKYQCYDLNNHNEPKKFWWRHWPTKPAGKPSTPRK